mmetsp:Transcript_11979/g.27667  ORF Transcript_11979/g.27667 Transcript_11979/m.27667 type:complete len:209 (+) Transcript_11979:988-1614(+)
MQTDDLAPSLLERQLLCLLHQRALPQPDLAPPLLHTTMMPRPPALVRPVKVRVPVPHGLGGEVLLQEALPHRVFRKHEASQLLRVEEGDVVGRDSLRVPRGGDEVCADLGVVLYPVERAQDRFDVDTLSSLLLQPHVDHAREVPGCRITILVDDGVRDTDGSVLNSLKQDLPDLLVHKVFVSVVILPVQKLEDERHVIQESLVVRLGC